MDCTNQEVYQYRLNQTKFISEKISRDWLHSKINDKSTACLGIGIELTTCTLSHAPIRT